MSEYRVGIIGCGRPRESEGATGFGMSHRHAAGYEKSADARIVALADIVRENAEAFQQEHGGDAIYLDYRQMLADENLDIVSICTWPHLHAPMVIDACRAGVKAIHCEKPMAPTYGEAVAMVEAAKEHGVQLTFNHQRRFGAPFRKARDLCQEGRIGDLVRLEAYCGNMYDWGTHWFDMMFFYNNEIPAEWVIGQIDPRDGHKVFGIYVEGQGISYIKFSNDVYGLLLTGERSQLEAANRLVGTEGVIEVGPSREVPLRMWGKGQTEWQEVALTEGLHGGDYVERAILDVIDALKTGFEPELAAQKALQATELIFATYESSRRRGRVDLPLDIEDSPLLSLMATEETGTYLGLSL